MAAAWQLARLPDVEIDVYEKSWRLGGKGASGRDEHGRIKEHGLHVWLGFYENAFRMMRQCYAEVQQSRSKPAEKLAHASMDDAFVPEPHIGVMIPDSETDSRLDPGKKWDAWSGLLPPAKGLPGEDLDEDTNPFTLSNYLLRCVELLKTLMLSVVGAPDQPVPGRPRPDGRSKTDETIEANLGFYALRSPEALLDWMTRYLRGGALTTLAGVLQGVNMLREWLRTANLSPQVPNTPLRFMEALAAQVRVQLSDLVGIDPALRAKTEVIDIVMTIIVGLYRDRVLFGNKGLDALNHIDYRKWLERHGATRTALDSRFLTGIYDLTFAYERGDRRKRKLAAGVALRGALRMFFTYRGSMFWCMRSGMGDAVFAPLYRVLMRDYRTIETPDGTIRPKPVRFHFMHSLSRVHLTGTANECFVKELQFVTSGQPEELDRLSAQALDHFGCWPDDARLMADAGDYKDVQTLVAGRDFDAVIFATGLEDFTQVFAASGALGHLPSKWGEMTKRVQTVATQAAQVWMSLDLEQLGWRRGPGIFTTFEPPFETWADMTHMYASERAWRASKAAQPHDGDPSKARDAAGPMATSTNADFHGDGADGATWQAPPGQHSASGPVAAVDGTRSISYFCGVLSETEVQREGDGIEGKIKRNLRHLLTRGIKPLWPAAFVNERAATNFLTHYYVKANVAGSDRYTLSLPRTIRYRISPLDRSVLNMSIAGDWTASGLDVGCVEAAVMSGMLAAYAVSGRTEIRKSIVGYDHP